MIIQSARALIKNNGVLQPQKGDFIMQSRKFIGPIAVSFLLAYFTAQPKGQAGPPQCDSGGGPTVCVQFDNVSEEPAENVHYVFNFANPATPNVTLLQGRNPQGTLYNWRVWSMDATAADGVGDIGKSGTATYLLSSRSRLRTSARSLTEKSESRIAA